VRTRLFALLALAVVTCGFPFDSAPAKVTPATGGFYARPGRLVDIGGYRLNLYCTGSGSPTVIFESGLGDSAYVWALVQPAVSKLTRTCSYDRAGFGFSDAGPMPRTAGREVAELHALLHNAGLAPPFVLVGHSLGGMLARLYTDRYFTEVAGLVLVDGAYEYQEAAFSPAIQKEDSQTLPMVRHCHALAARGRLTDTKLLRDCLDVDPLDKRFSPALQATLLTNGKRVAFWDCLISEFQSFFAESAAEVRSSQRPFGSLPLVVLTADSHGEKQADRALIEKPWRMLQDKQARLSSNSRHILIHSGHHIQLDAPNSVIDAVRIVLREVRTREVGIRYSRSHANCRNGGYRGRTNNLLHATHKRVLRVTASAPQK